MKFTKKAIETKIQAIQKIVKITKAMKIVALLKFQNLLQKIPNFSQLLTDWQTIMAVFTPLMINAKLPSPRQRITILFTSDLGLCGSYNSNLFQFCQSTPLNKLIVIGKKGINHFKFINQPLFNQLTQIEFKQPQTQAALIKQLVALAKEPTNQFEIIYTHPVSLTEFTVKKLSLWPVVQSNRSSITTESVKQTITNRPLPVDQLTFEPAAKLILMHQLAFYFQSLLVNCSWAAELSEQSIRQRTMQNAHENAEKIVTELKFQYNQIRQEKITSEILEISRG